MTAPTSDELVERLKEALNFHEGKRAPVQGYIEGLPWDMHLKAYDAYCRECGKQPALIDLEGRRCRGGFSTEELDHFIPGWRDEIERRRDNARTAIASMPRIDEGGS